MKTFKQKYGPWALVTGASSGIGEQYAKQLAAKKLNLMLVARRKERLETLAKALNTEHKIETKVIAADLASDDGLKKVTEETNTMEIGLLVNNAGIEDSGHFLDTPLDKALDVLDTNCKAPLVLTHHFAKKMVERKRGGILFMSSLVAVNNWKMVLGFIMSMKAKGQHYCCCMAIPLGRFFTVKLLTN